MIHGKVEIGKAMARESTEYGRESIDGDATYPHFVRDILEVVIAQIPVEQVVKTELAFRFLVGRRGAEFVGPITDVDVKQSATRSVRQGHAPDNVTDGIKAR